MVRDFAWGSSRKFVWDAMAVEGAKVNGKPVMAMSLYPKEGMPLWDKYSTHAIAHTIQVYSRYTFDYPYPVAWSIHGAIGGMEYPMICFNGPRPEKDGTYPEKTKYALIGVVIHEVGHNYFPMIVNSDERQWTWMDEGLNSFVEFLTEEEWENDWKHRRNERGMTDYMRLKDRAPVMTNSESIADLGPNAYGQPTVALNILREHILGREAFDHAFQRVFLHRQFRQPGLDHVPDGNQANQFARLDHRNVAKAAVCHFLQHAIGIIGAAAGDDFGGHDRINRLCQTG